MTPDLDRNYYRACSDSALVVMARDSANELALVLGEALAEAIDASKRDNRYIDALEANVERLEREIDDLRSALFD